MRTADKKAAYAAGIFLCILLFDIFTGRGSLFVDDMLKAEDALSTAFLSDNAAIVSSVVAEKGTSVENTGTSSKTIFFQVIKVVDGDTLTINMNGEAETIRLIGINTPETVDPRKEVECFGIEASDRAKELLSGKYVRIETDPAQGERDKYKRLLAYVYLQDGLFFNEYMIKEGYAYEYTYDTPYKYQTSFKEAQAFAKASEKGLWAQEACN